MEESEYQRLVLMALAEMVELLGEIAYPSPYKGTGGRSREIADTLRVAAERVHEKETTQ